MNTSYSWDIPLKAFGKVLPPFFTPMSIEFLSQLQNIEPSCCKEGWISIKIGTLQKQRKPPVRRGKTNFVVAQNLFVRFVTGNHGHQERIFTLKNITEYEASNSQKFLSGLNYSRTYRKSGINKTNFTLPPSLYFFELTSLISLSTPNLW